MTGVEVMLLALGWVCIIEGIGPLAMTQAWQRSVRRLSDAPLSVIRGIGAILVGIGLAIVWLCA